jgi:hypothetical protein
MEQNEKHHIKQIYMQAHCIVILLCMPISIYSFLKYLNNLVDCSGYMLTFNLRFIILLPSYWITIKLRTLRKKLSLILVKKIENMRYMT